LTRDFEHYTRVYSANDSFFDHGFNMRLSRVLFNVIIYIYIPAVTVSKLFFNRDALSVLLLFRAAFIQKSLIYVHTYVDNGVRLSKTVLLRKRSVVFVLIRFTLNYIMPTYIRTFYLPYNYLSYDDRTFEYFIKLCSNNTLFLKNVELLIRYSFL